MTVSRKCHPRDSRAPDKTVEADCRNSTNLLEMLEDHSCDR